MIVHAAAPVTLVGGGPIGNRDLGLALELAPRLVAVDGGAMACLKAGLTPDAVIGDLDSLTPEARAALADRLHPVAEQVTTDFDKALRHVDVPALIGIGFSGGRLDHELAALSGLMRASGRKCLLLGPETLCFLCPPEIALDLPAGLLVSLFPLAPVGLRSTGLVWPTDGLDFRPDGRLGTSNAAAGGPARLWADAPHMLVILPRAALAPAFAALVAATAWPDLSSSGR